jgi:predicted protein tyrosine phosphatase
MRNILFVCSQNKLRSPTAERIFSDIPNIEVDSAGLNHDAVQPITSEQIEWADVIFVMEKTHKNKLQKNYKRSLKSQSVVCLDIPDDYAFMDDELVFILKKKVGSYLGIRFPEKID